MVAENDLQNTSITRETVKIYLQWESNIQKELYGICYIQLKLSLC